LWGVPEVSDETATVEAVDLHIGQHLRFEIGSNWIRVFLYDSTFAVLVAGG
jgi:hypothetical protein